MKKPADKQIVEVIRTLRIASLKKRRDYLNQELTELDRLMKKVQSDPLKKFVQGGNLDKDITRSILTLGRDFWTEHQTRLDPQRLLSNNYAPGIQANWDDTTIRLWIDKHVTCSQMRPITISKRTLGVIGFKNPVPLELAPVIIETFGYRHAAWQDLLGFFLGNTYRGWLYPLIATGERNDRDFLQIDKWDYWTGSCRLEWCPRSETSSEKKFLVRLK